MIYCVNLIKIKGGFETNCRLLDFKLTQNQFEWKRKNTLDQKSGKNT